jgi:hypothetical protein
LWLLIVLLRRWLAKGRPRRFTPATARRGRSTLGRLRVTGTATKDARQETTAACRGRGRGLGPLQLILQLLDLLRLLLVLRVETLERVFLHQDRLGHVVPGGRLASHVLLDPCFCLRIARG